MLDDMQKKRIHKTGLVWSYGFRGDVFPLLKFLQQHAGNLHVLMNDDAGQVSELVAEYANTREQYQAYDIELPVEQPNCDAVAEFNLGWGAHYELLVNVNDSFLWSLALLMESDNASVFLFSQMPDVQWLHGLLQRSSQEPSPAGDAYAVLECWDDILQRFDFALFNTLPDWDRGQQALIMTPHQALRDVLLATCNGNNRLVSAAWEQFALG